jgi:hypothetical protein
MLSSCPAIVLELDPGYAFTLGQRAETTADPGRKKILVQSDAFALDPNPGR